MTDIPADHSDVVGADESGGPHDAPARASDLAVDGTGATVSPNGSAHDPGILASAANGIDAIPSSNATERSSADSQATPAPRTRQRRARQRAEPPPDAPPHPNGATDADQIVAQPEGAPPPTRRPRRPKKQASDVPILAERETQGEPTTGAMPEDPRSDGLPIPEATLAVPIEAIEETPTSRTLLDVPYTSPDSYRPAPDPFQGLDHVGGTIATVEAPTVADEPAPMSVDLTPPPSPPAPPNSAEAGDQPTPPSPDDEFDDEGGTMTIIEHLEELRKRLMWCLGAIAVGSFIGWFLAPTMVELARQPLIGKADVITLTVFGAFVLQIKMAVAVGVCLSMPVTLYHIWGFVAPGLTRREKRYARPFILLGTVLFIFGAAVGYFVFPKGVAFALTFNGSLGIKPTIEANGYVSFIALIMILFGIAFELPVFMVFLSLIGLFSSRAMLSRWRVAIVVIWAGSMVVTPGADIVSPVILASILTVLYFLGIWLTKLVGR